MRADRARHRFAQGCRVDVDRTAAFPSLHRRTRDAFESRRSMSRVARYQIDGGRACLSNKRAMAQILSLASRHPDASFSPRGARRMENMDQFLFHVPLQGEIAKASAAPACAATGTCRIGFGIMCARGAAADPPGAGREGDAESDGAEMHARNITGFPGYCNGAGSPAPAFLPSQYTYPDSRTRRTAETARLGGSEITRINPRTISRITANGTDRRN